MKKKKQKLLGIKLALDSRQSKRNKFKLSNYQVSQNEGYSKRKPSKVYLE